MSLPVFAIRPEPGLAATLVAWRAAGIAITGTPLFDIRLIDWQAPAVDEIDGLLLGSANAVRHAGSALGHFSGKPAYVVGDATADAAIAAGLVVAGIGTGGLQGVLGSLAGQRLRLLRLAGAEHVPLVPPGGITLVTRIVYESASLPMPDDLAEALRGGGLVLLHSAAAARHFAAECDRLGIARQGLRIVALGPRILAAAGGGWAIARAATQPREVELLALVRQLCH